MKLILERTYGDHLQLGGAEEHFADDLCGELDQSLTDDKGKLDTLNDSYEGKWTLEDGRILDVEIFLSETEYSSIRDDESQKEYEWVCKAYSQSE